ncbi:MAG: phosphotransferase [Mycobacterium sp.]|nr:phosphotransferase [Mycobacterium sp.]
MASPSVSMLWETVDADAALTCRFGFATADEAARWLAETLSTRYEIELGAVDRLVLSSRNLMAWTVTSEGPLIVKCCVHPEAHPRLRAIAELLAWLARDGFPVSAPIPTPDGELQLECGNLSVGVQRIIAAEMLDTTRLDQAARAGAVLARLHQAMSRYPNADDLDFTPMPALEADVAEWLDKNAPGEPHLRDAVATLRLKATGLDSTGLDSQLIHRDFRAANILWADNDIVAVLDFEQLARGHRVSDVVQAATLLGTHFHNWGPLTPEALDAFLAAYQTQLPFSAKERAWLAVLSLRNAIGFAQQPGPMQEQWVAAAERLAASAW